MGSLLSRPQPSEDSIALRVRIPDVAFVPETNLPVHATGSSASLIEYLESLPCIPPGHRLLAESVFLLCPKHGPIKDGIIYCLDHTWQERQRRAVIWFSVEPVKSEEGRGEGDGDNDATRNQHDGEDIGTETSDDGSEPTEGEQVGGDSCTHEEADISAHEMPGETGHDASEGHSNGRTRLEPTTTRAALANSIPADAIELPQEGQTKSIDSDDMNSEEIDTAEVQNDLQAHQRGTQSDTLTDRTSVGAEPLLPSTTTTATNSSITDGSAADTKAEADLQARRQMLQGRLSSSLAAGRREFVPSTYRPPTQQGHASEMARWQSRSGLAAPFTYATGVGLSGGPHGDGSGDTGDNVNAPAEEKKSS